MEIKGEYQIDASRELVWQALNDPEMLQKCIPGCESLEKISDNEYAAKVTAAIGPVRAKFNTALRLEDLDPPASYRLVGESKAAAGGGSGSAGVNRGFCSLDRLDLTCEWQSGCSDFWSKGRQIAKRKEDAFWLPLQNSVEQMRRICK